ncbi:Uncharacterised protein [Yersinia frederiksenii]|uniref:hypothetical protein n=1 Tax=Yersinia frederiksenii TaxID=29484 RepID=UPI0005DE7F97|nr:hypothetical protein [Yersinia frederiksenii]CND07725.1 Uncharacterised protein [Yersinia frederiksenii]
MNKLTEQELIELTVVYGNRHNACRAAKELLEARAELAAIKGEQQPVGFVKCNPCAEDCRWDCVDPLYLAGPVTPEGYGSDYFEVYRHPAPLKDNTDGPM